MWNKKVVSTICHTKMFCWIKNVGGILWTESKGKIIEQKPMKWKKNSFSSSDDII